VIDIAHGREDVFRGGAELFFPVGDVSADTSPNGAGAEGATAGHHGDAFAFDVTSG